MNSMAFKLMRPAAKPAAIPIATIEVGVAIVFDAKRRVLVAERRAHQKSAGYWEFPGGKIEPGETPAMAAARELDEEVGLQADPARLRPFAVHLHRFDSQMVRLHLFVAEDWQGAPHGREGQRFAWIDPAQPENLPILPSNIRALTLLGLSPLVQRLNPQEPGAPSPSDVLLDIPRLPPVQRRSLAMRSRSVFRQGRLWIRGGMAEAAAAGADVHLGTVGAPPPQATPARRAVWAVPCHSSGEMPRAEAAGADLLVLQVPQLADGTPDWEGFGTLARASRLPVWADGNLSADHLDPALAQGATGLICG